MSFNDFKLQEIIKPACIDHYKQAIERLWVPIVDINSNVFILDKIFKFPLDLFQPFRLLFWKVLVKNFYAQIILKMHIVIFDSNDNTLNIKKLRDLLVTQCKSEDIRSSILRELKQINFDREIKNFEKQISLIRNKYIAHIDQYQPSKIDEISLSDTALDFNELKVITININMFFTKLCFDEERALIYWEYARDAKSGCDIDEILLSLARDSDLLNMPEKQADFWPVYKSGNLSPEELATINKYRKIFNLPGA